MRGLTGLPVLVALLCAAASVSAEATSPPWSAGAFASGPRDNRFALAAGLGMNSGLAAGATWSGPFVGAKVLAGYLPAYTTPPGCTIFCGTDGITLAHGTAVAADLLLPLLCDRRTCLGLEGGYRHSSLLGHGGGVGLHATSTGPGWLRVSGTLGASYYPQGLGQTPLFLATNLSGSQTDSLTLGTQLMLSFSPWLSRALKAR